MRQAASRHRGEDETGVHKRLRLWIACGVGGVCLLMVVVGGPVTKIVALVLGACVLQGLWRGASEILSVIVGMVVGMALAQPVGRMIEGSIASMLGTGGVTNRLLSIAIAAVSISAIVTVVISFIIKIAWKKRALPEGWRTWDKVAGAGLGLVEGTFLSMLLLWAPLAIEPVAAAEAATSVEEGGASPAPSTARRAVGWAKAVRDSAFGRIAEATNPVQGSETLGLIEDFLAVVRDPEAMDWFLKSEPMQRLRDTPSVGEAVRRLESDPELSALLGREGPITSEGVRAVLDSPALLKVIDETTVVRDLGPMAGEIGRALREARARVKK